MRGQPALLPRQDDVAAGEIGGVDGNDVQRIAAADGRMHAVAARAEAHGEPAAEQLAQRGFERHAASSRTKATALGSLANDSRATGTLPAISLRVSTTVSKPCGSWNGGKAHANKLA